ncbi:DUF998 domain-containing protein [Kytococcus sedentarius]|uniref:DUF998 domain-containing protein n=1 Tax=Kytococcus sedentarius TaxID=1276 RepID=UPI0035BC0D03
MVDREGVSRWRWGAWLWVASSVLVLGQLVAAAAWPDGYSLARNAISDLGVTACGEFSEGGAQARPVCSPWHAVFNGSMVLTGVLTALGAAGLWGHWPGATGRLAMVLMGVAGMCMVAVGLAPWDVRPELHDIAALGTALAQWGAMLLLLVTTRGWVRVFTAAALIVSVVGFVAFLAALDGAEVAALPFGVAERLGFDTLTLWTVVMGGVVLGSVRRPVAHTPLRA